MLTPTAGIAIGAAIEVVAPADEVIADVTITTFLPFGCLLVFFGSLMTHDKKFCTNN